jgi:8-oxo-dGTP pyrophosphatase MutT (NUDIX family)
VPQSFRAAAPHPGTQRLSPYPFDARLREHIRAHLAVFDPSTQDTAGLRAAAVTIAVIPATAAGHAGFLLTQRPETLNRHAGQFALPGGRIDAGERDIEAALRELEEELGLRVPESAVLGRLDDFPTRSGFRIRPFVAWIEDLATLEPDPREVAHCHKVPLTDLDDRRVPTLRDAPYGEHPVLSMFLKSLDDEIFAPTAAMIYQFREVALAGRATRVSHYEQPRFAWC